MLMFFVVGVTAFVTTGDSATDVSSLVIVNRFLLVDNVSMDFAVSLSFSASMLPTGKVLLVELTIVFIDDDDCDFFGVLHVDWLVFRYLVEKTQKYC